MKLDETKPLERGEIIQIMPPHEWAGCLAVVEVVKSFGCLAYVTGPTANGPDSAAPFYIRLDWKDFERIGAFVIAEPVT